MADKKTPIVDAWKAGWNIADFPPSKLSVQNSLKYGAYAGIAAIGIGLLGPAIGAFAAPALPILLGAGLVGGPIAGVVLNTVGRLVTKAAAAIVSVALATPGELVSTLIVRPFYWAGSNIKKLFSKKQTEEEKQRKSLEKEEKKSAEETAAATPGTPSASKDAKESKEAVQVKSNATLEEVEKHFEAELSPEKLEKNKDGSLTVTAKAEIDGKLVDVGTFKVYANEAGGTTWKANISGEPPKIPDPARTALLDDMCLKALQASKGKEDTVKVTADMGSPAQQAELQDSLNRAREKLGLAPQTPDNSASLTAGPAAPTPTPPVGTQPLEIKIFGPNSSPDPDSNPVSDKTIAKATDVTNDLKEITAANDASITPSTPLADNNKSVDNSELLAKKNTAKLLAEAAMKVKLAPLPPPESPGVSNENTHVKKPDGPGFT